MCGNISEYKLHGGKNEQKKQGFVIYIGESTFFQECVNNVVATRDRSEAVVPITEPVEMLQLQRIVFPGLSTPPSVTNCGIKASLSLEGAS